MWMGSLKLKSNPLHWVRNRQRVSSLLHTLCNKSICLCKIQTAGNVGPLMMIVKCLSFQFLSSRKIPRGDNKSA